MDALNRREVTVGVALGLACGSVPQRSIAAPDAPPSEASRGSLTTPPEAVVATTCGAVRGFWRNGVYIFRGLPYGEDPSGARRFLPPNPANPWTAVRSCLSYGPVCPQPRRDWSNDELAFIADWNDGYPGENCLTLNIWSSRLDASARRPVIVWLHGGGFSSGSAHELPAYEGSRLTARGTVVVSANHRLGPFGFLDLSEYHERYAQSGNAGMLDLVLALRWVRDNIARFGGDPERVTIAGQSGGGGKVSALMAMPEAKGLFHRAVIMSGSFSPAQAQSDARALTGALFDQLGLQRGTVDALSSVEPERLVQAGEAAIRRVHGPAGVPGLGRGRLGPIKGWSPVADGGVLPVGVWQNAAPPISSQVPMLIGNVRDEFKLPGMVFDQEGLRELASRIHGQSAPALLAALSTEFPALSPNEKAGILTGVQFHNAAVDQCVLKARQGGAAVWQYWFVFSPDLLDGRVGVPHCADIAYFFDNAAACDQQTGNSTLANRVAAQMSSALVRFAATGNPADATLSWPQFSEADRQTMVFGSEARAVRYPGARVFELARGG